MAEFILSIQQASTLSIVVAMLFAISVWWFLREIAGLPALALLSIPCIVLGSLTANYLATKLAVPLVQDQQASVAIAGAAGVIVALVLLIIIAWLWMKMSDFTTKRRTKRLFGHSQATPKN